jgi:hypothetical protein
MLPQKRSKVPLLVGVIGGILVVAGIVVLVLWLTMWKDGGGGSGDPIALAEKYISALEKGDADAFIDCFDPDFFTGEEMAFLEEMGMDFKQLMRMSMEMMEVEFKDYALELEFERGNEARVVTTSGTVIFSVMGFEEEYDLADDPMVFEMVKKNGRWYLTEDPMPGSMGSDFDLEMDFDDFDDYEFDDLDIESLMDFLPEGYTLEDLENMSPEELMRLFEDMQWLMEDYSQ